MAHGASCHVHLPIFNRKQRFAVGYAQAGAVAAGNIGGRDSIKSCAMFEGRMCTLSGGRQMRRTRVGLLLSSAATISKVVRSDGALARLLEQTAALEARFSTV